MSSPRRAVFLDRDGVINPMWMDPDHGLVDSPRHPDQFSLLPDAGESIRHLKELGFLTVVISNQPGVAKGKLTHSILQAITEKMVAELAADGASLDGIYYCLHHPDAVVEALKVECACRKPRPGLLAMASQELSIDLRQSYMVGDGLTDIQAGARAGCRTIWVGNWKCEICRVARSQPAEPDLIAANLFDAVRLIRAGG